MWKGSIESVECEHQGFWFEAYNYTSISSVTSPVPCTDKWGCTARVTYDPEMLGQANHHAAFKFVAEYVGFPSTVSSL